MRSAVKAQVGADGGRVADGAMRDIYDDRRKRLDEFLAAISLHEGQTGALVLVGGRPVVLDHVSRPDVFAALHGPLIRGYAVDALEAGNAGGGSGLAAIAERFPKRACSARARRIG